MRSDDKPQQSGASESGVPTVMKSGVPTVMGSARIGSRRRLSLSLAALAAFPVVLLAACGNADHKVGNDERPDPRASTEGVQTAVPAPVTSVPAVEPSALSGVTQQKRPVDGDPAQAIPPEDLVSEQGFGSNDTGDR